MTDADTQLLRDFKQLIDRFVSGAEVMLYGSRARGNPDPSSDYDFIVLTERSIPAETDARLQDAIYDFELDRQVVFSILVFSRDQWDTPGTVAAPFRRRVEREAVAL